MASHSISKGTKLWLGNSFRHEGKSIAGCEAVLVSSYRESKNQHYVVRTESYGLLHGRYADFVIPNKKLDPEGLRRPNRAAFEQSEQVAE